jgi:membrane protease YdiL (CAAX protease family)
VAVLVLGGAAWAFGARDVDGLGVFSGAPVLDPLLLVLLVLVVNGFGEETGWRGFLAERLLVSHSPRATSVLVFLAWSVWHLPMFAVVPGLRGLGWATFGWALGLLAGSVVLTWLYTEGRHSVLLVAAWHTAFNLTSATQATEGVVAATTSTAVMLAAVVVWWRWRQDSSRAETSSYASASAARSTR